jgi:hypothetical protein
LSSPSKGSQLLIFELQVGESVDFALNLLSAKLHVSGLFGLVDGVLTTPFTSPGVAFYVEVIVS